MGSFRTSSGGLLRRLFGGDSNPPPPAGPRVVLDGIAAALAVESHAKTTVAASPHCPGRRHFDTAAPPRLDAESPRAALAVALGLAATGRRATVFLDGPDLLGGIDLLGQAAGRHVPLVTYAVSRATGGPGGARGTGHEAYYAAADVGGLQLYAVNVQEVADLAVIARLVAERGLVPAVVAMDGAPTATTPQTLALPEPECIASLLGAPSDVDETPTEPQRLLFGDTRRRVPRLHDLEQPLLRGATMGEAAWGLAVAGARPYFTEPLPALLAQAFDAFADATGRRYDAIVTHEIDDAEIVLVAQGAAFETARAVARVARKQHDRAVGVLGVRCLRPWPSAAIARALAGRRVVAVLDRAESLVAGDGPLLREVREALGRARENDRFGDDTHPGHPSIPDARVPRLVNVTWGLGGLPLRSADLLDLIETLTDAPRPRIALGVEFVRKGSALPKHQARLDALRRIDPDLATRGLRSRIPPPHVLPDDAITIGVVGPDDDTTHRLARATARLLSTVLGGTVRCRGHDDVVLVIHGLEPLDDPGDDVAIDIAVVRSLHAGARGHLPDRLASDGSVLLLAGDEDDARAVETLSRPLRAALRARDGGLHIVGGSTERGTPDTIHSRALGAILALRLRRAGRSMTTAEIRDAWTATPVDRRDAAVEVDLAALVSGFETVRPIRLAPEADTVAAPAAPRPTPLLLRTLGTDHASVASLPRFWDHIGVHYERGRPDELLADPGLAMGVVPPLTGLLRTPRAVDGHMPIFDAATYDGDPGLWMNDPDGVVAAVVLSTQTLLEAGITRAGADANILRSIASRLARRANTIAASKRPPVTAGELFRAAFDANLAKMDAPRDRQDALRAGLQAVLAEIGDLPIAVTDTFFLAPERESPGTGELLIAAANPDARFSLESLRGREGRGITIVPRTPERIEAARRLWSLWEQLPDTSPATIDRAAHTGCRSARCGHVVASVLPGGGGRR